MLKSKASLNSNVVELNNDWQQVGGLLGDVMSRLQVVPAKSPASVSAAPLDQARKRAQSRFESRKAA